jgi:hypothetical protein
MAKLFQSEKHVFWQALIVALIIFNFGIFLGYMLESARVGKVSELYAESELALLDVKIQSELFNFEDLDCNIAIKENTNFADRIFEEAKILDRFETASRITENIKLQHKKYDLLRTLFWINSIKIKNRCNASFHDVVYFYQYNEPSTGQKAKQAVFSKVLEELKDKKGEKVMLIPIAADNNISAVDILLKSHNISVLPTILIDEEIKITELTSVEELEEFID